MEHHFKYPLDTGDDITVTVDTNDSEPMPVLCFPASICGHDHMAKMLQAASLEAERIQARATEEWEEQRALIVQQRKDGAA